jgi:hypothetical protein
MVQLREGKLRPIQIKSGWCIEDSNVFACGIDHIKAVVEMLKTQDKPAVFAGGIDCRIFDQEHLDIISSIRVEKLFFACDTMATLPHLKRVHDELLFDKPEG